MKNLFLTLLFLCVALSAWFLLSEIYTATVPAEDKIVFEVKKGETVKVLAQRLEDEGVIRNSWLFVRFVALKESDKKIQVGTFTVEKPVTLIRVVEALNKPTFEEREITIIPGWGLKEIAEYFEKQGIATKDEVYELTGIPAFDYKSKNQRAEFLNADLKILNDKPKYASLEGYLAPDTFRVYEDATLEEILIKLLEHRESQISEEMYAQIKKSGRTFYEVLIMASILEKEVRGLEDKKKVADLFWRRLDVGMALQADSTVHYLTQKSGDVFTTQADRKIDSPWNTYFYPGLPLGPISTPSLESIEAAIYPEPNDYWFFLTTFDGDVKYAKTLEEHNNNVYKYLR